MSSKTSEFAAQPFVQRCLQETSTPKSVLSFFFGVDYDNEGDVDENLRKGACFSTMSDLWYKGGPEYDELCQPFASTIRAAGQGRLQGQEWESTVDGRVAIMILCDQLARNVFRSKPEAFSYDDIAIEVYQDLASIALATQPNADCALVVDGDIKGEIYPPYLSFMIVAAMHSESADDHEKALQLLDFCQASTDASLQHHWEYQRQFELEHKAVIDRFGRYPHRNKAKGRESTPEELAWLADAEVLPAWAKSQ